MLMLLLLLLVDRLDKLKKPARQRRGVLLIMKSATRPNKNEVLPKLIHTP